MYEQIPDNPYLLLTPGPLSTSKGVRAAMLRDWCTWDEEYNLGVVQKIRGELARLASRGPEGYTAVLMQGSGSFCVEACLGTAVPRDGKLLILVNGAYGARMAEMARVLGIAHTALYSPETERPDMALVQRALEEDAAITHIAMVHCETTTGILNDLEPVSRFASRYQKRLIVDAMSSFGGIPIDMRALKIDYLISSANKCIQGVPGFGFVIADRDALSQCAGNARSLSLDLYAQWKEMDSSGKWRYTSPTHAVRAFLQALAELAEEGGIGARYDRYRSNQRALAQGMEALGFRPLLPERLQSPFITSFLYPGAAFSFPEFYARVKERGFVLYPGKISQADTFRIGTIGEVYPGDIARLLAAIGEIAAPEPETVSLTE